MIRLLIQNDTEQFKNLRLTVLQSDPDSFLSTYDIEMNQPDHFFRYTILDGSEQPHFGYFGYFDDEKLLGYVQLTRLFFPKQSHSAQIFNLSVMPEYRSKGIGKQLMTHVMDHAQQAKLEIVFLSCLSKNKPAQKLYESLGFELTGRRPKAIKWNGEYQDKLSYSKVLSS